MNDFSRDKRLLTARQFNTVFSGARKVTMPEILLLYRKNDIGKARLGMAFSKRHIPKATNRNRIKRILRESFRCNRLPSVDIIAVARHGLDGVSNPVLKSRLEHAWKKLNASQER